MTDIAVRNGSAPAQQAAALAIRPGQVMWDDFQMAALDQIGLKDASNADRAVFLHQCQRTGLDPFSRQIYMIGRPEKQPDGKWRTKWTIQTGIDGFRVNRARAEREAGVRGILGRAVFYDHDGSEHKVWVRNDPPAACEITYTVKDANGETPYTSVLRFDEYVQTKTENGQRVAVAQWAVKPAHMLEKCTEADVYRKAFPQDFSGIDLSDAMPPADPDAPPVQPQRQRVTAETIAARRQPVQATVVPEDVPPAETPADPPQRPAGGTSTPDERPPALAASGQVSQIQRHFRRLGIDPDTGDGYQAMLTAAARITGLAAIASLQELTQDEAARVIDLIKPLHDGAIGAQALADLLNDGIAPEGGA